MFCEIKNYVDVEAKQHFQSSEAAQFVLTLYAFLGTLLIKINYLGCGGWQWKIWVDFVFFGSLLWLAVILIISIGKYKNPNFRLFLRILDFAYFAFLLAAWIWLVVLFGKKEFLGCSDPMDMFGIIFLVMGGLAVVVLVLGVLGWVWSLLRPSDNSNRGAIYNEDVDFNPYQ